MIVLGIYDWHNCGASLVADGRIVSAIEEERLTRNRVEFGFPALSVNKIFEMTGISWGDLDAIGVCGERDPFFLARINPRVFRFERKICQKWRLQYILWRMIFSIREGNVFEKAERFLSKKVVGRQIEKMSSGASRKVVLISHHLCHASCGYRTSGFERALIFTIDGSGDGYSTAVFSGENGNIKFISGASERASLGKLYSNVTLGLGFDKLTGEGKVMGLAALGDPRPFYPVIDKVIWVDSYEPMFLKCGEDLIGNTFALKVRRFLRDYSREDIAAATQAKFENILLGIVDYYVKKTGITSVVLVGGAAMNVSFNQKVRELDCVSKSYVFPSMTDAGVASGAALELHWRLSGNSGVYELKDVFLGPGESEDQFKECIKKNCLSAEYREDIEQHIAYLVSQGFIVARVDGRMEYGPRALGNRSILALPNKEGLGDILNQRLKRDEFMPFAPSILEEYASQYLEGYRYSPFMTETFNLKKEFAGIFSAVTHKDNTVRPHIVRKQVCPGYWNIIKEIGDITGYYLVLNTSFNMHGEPIICSAQDAVNTFLKGSVDYLCLGKFLIKY
ncbi:MAG: hypothetical protein NT033_03765 [Candidatus Omnitrophica bacterium]|nr:hypothetical protein [Candidatus Omnitrophota bacterium]